MSLPLKSHCTFIAHSTNSCNIANIKQHHLPAEALAVTQRRRDLQALIDARARRQNTEWRVIIYCFLVVMLDGFDTAAIDTIAPDIRTLTGS